MVGGVQGGAKELAGASIGSPSGRSDRDREYRKSTNTTHGNSYGFKQVDWATPFVNTCLPLDAT